MYCIVLYCIVMYVCIHVCMYVRHVVICIYIYLMQYSMDASGSPLSPRTRLSPPPKPAASSSSTPPRIALPWGDVRQLLTSWSSHGQVPRGLLKGWWKHGISWGRNRWFASWNRCFFFGWMEPFEQRRVILRRFGWSFQAKSIPSYEFIWDMIKKNMC